MRIEYRHHPKRQRHGKKEDSDVSKANLFCPRSKHSRFFVRRHGGSRAGITNSRKLRARHLTAAERATEQHLLGEMPGARTPRRAHCARVSSRVSFLLSFALLGATTLTGCDRVRCALPGVTCVAGIPFAKATVESFAGGKARKGMLSSDATVQKVPFKAQSTLELREDGTLERATLSGDTTVEGTTFRSGTVLGFRATGTVEYAKLSKATTVQMQDCRGGAEVLFDDKGKLLSDWGNDRKPTGLAFKTEISMSKGGVYRMEVRKGPSGLAWEPVCGGRIVVEKFLYGTEAVPLKSTELTQDCMVQTKDYGNIQLKMQPLGGSEILLTSKQEEAFRLGPPCRSATPPR